MTTASTIRTISHFLGKRGISHPLHDDAAEQARWLHGQHEDDDDQRHGQLLAVAYDVDAGRLLDLVAGESHHVFQYADDKAADPGAARITDAAHQRAGEGVEQAA